MQEYNICFTTVRRPENGGIAPLPEPSQDMAVLPKACSPCSLPGAVGQGLGMRTLDLVLAGFWWSVWQPLLGCLLSVELPSHGCRVLYKALCCKPDGIQETENFCSFVRACHMLQVRKG